MADPLTAASPPPPDGFLARADETDDAVFHPDASPRRSTPQGSDPLWAVWAAVR